MRVEEGRLATRAAPLPLRPVSFGDLRGLREKMTSGVGLMLYSSMKHRTQLYLDDGQYRWLQRQAGKAGSIAAVVRGLIDAERARVADPAADPLLRFLVDEAPGRGRQGTSVTTLDRDLYGS
jgi:hypothetical protein